VDLTWGTILSSGTGTSEERDVCPMRRSVARGYVLPTSAGSPGPAGIARGLRPTVHDLLFHFARSRSPFVALVLIHKVPQNHIEAGLGGGRTGSTLQWPEQRQSTYSSPEGSSSDGTDHLARSRSLVLGSWACPDVFKHQFLEGVELRSVL
jgi:hypothetical protein